MPINFTDADYLDFALQKLKPNAIYTFNDADYETINWIILDGEAPTEEEIKVEIIRLKEQFVQEEIDRSAKRQALLDKLGITAEEAALLLGGN